MNKTMSELEILLENIQIKSSEVQKHTVEVMRRVRLTYRCDENVPSDLPKLGLKMRGSQREKNACSSYAFIFMYSHQCADLCRDV